MSRTFLTETVETNSLVNKFEECKVHILNVKMKYMNGTLGQDDDGLRDVILVAGGCGQGLYFSPFLQLFPFSDAIFVNNIYGYVIQEGRWTELAPLPNQMRKPFVTYDPSGVLYVFDSSNAADSTRFFVYKYKILEKMWTSFKVVHPTTITNMSVQSIVACNGKLYVVGSGMLSGKPAGDEWQCFLMETKEAGEESVIKCSLFVRNLNTQLTSCAIANRYVSILGWKHGSKSKRGHGRGYCKFIYFDTNSGMRRESSKGANYESIMFGLGNEVVTGRPGKLSAKKFSFQEKRWKPVRELSLPLTPEDAGRVDFSYACHGQDFYVLGGKNNSTKKPINTAFKYNFPRKDWTKLEDMPQALMHSGATMARFPLDQVRCHINCPHCSFLSRRSQAVYQVERPVEEDEDDYSYDEDDDYASDYFDEDFDVYDPYDEYWY